MMLSRSRSVEGKGNFLEIVISTMYVHFLLDFLEQK